MIGQWSFTLILKQRNRISGKSQESSHKVAIKSLSILNP